MLSSIKSSLSNYYSYLDTSTAQLINLRKEDVMTCEITNLKWFGLSSRIIGSDDKSKEATRKSSSRVLTPAENINDDVNCAHSCATNLPLPKPDKILKIPSCSSITKENLPLNIKFSTSESNPILCIQPQPTILTFYNYNLNGHHLEVPGYDFESRFFLEESENEILEFFWIGKLTLLLIFPSCVRTLLVNSLESVVSFGSYKFDLISDNESGEHSLETIFNSSYSEHHYPLNNSLRSNHVTALNHPSLQSNNASGILPGLPRSIASIPRRSAKFHWAQLYSARLLPFIDKSLTNYYNTKYHKTIAIGSEKKIFMFKCEETQVVQLSSVDVDQRKLIRNKVKTRNRSNSREPASRYPSTDSARSANGHANANGNDGSLAIDINSRGRQLGNKSNNNQRSTSNVSSSWLGNFSLPQVQGGPGFKTLVITRAVD